MLEICSLSSESAFALEGLSYDKLDNLKKTAMLLESERGEHNGKFFKLFAVVVDGETVGVMNVCAKSKSVISIAPEIKEKYRRKGYAFIAEQMLFNLLKEKGYKIALATIKKDNLASIALQEKLGFEFVKEYVSDKGNELLMYLKSL